MKAYFASQFTNTEYKKRAEKFYSNLDSRQYGAVLYYSDGGHKRVNYASSPAGVSLAEDIAQALTFTDREQKIVYRASNDFQVDIFEVGALGEFPAFVSTSYNPQTVFKFLNKEQPTIYVIETFSGAEISMIHDEMEVLLPKGLQFEIVQIQQCDFYAAYPETDYHVSRENVKIIYLKEKSFSKNCG